MKVNDNDLDKEQSYNVVINYIKELNETINILIKKGSSSFDQKTSHEFYRKAYNISKSINHPSNIPYLIGYEKIHKSCQYQYALLNTFYRSDYDLAVKLADELLQKEPDNVHYLAIKVYCGVKQLSFEKDIKTDTQGIEKNILNILEKDPDFSLMYWNMAQIRAYNGDEKYKYFYKLFLEKFDGNYRGVHYFHRERKYTSLKAIAEKIIQKE